MAAASETTQRIARLTLLLFVVTNDRRTGNLISPVFKYQARRFLRWRRKR
jgi:hypothetical protein